MTSVCCRTAVVVLEVQRFGESFVDQSLSQNSSSFVEDSVSEEVLSTKACHRTAVVFVEVQRFRESLSTKACHRTAVVFVEVQRFGESLSTKAYHRTAVVVVEARTFGEKSSFAFCDHFPIEIMENATIHPSTQELLLSITAATPNRTTMGLNTTATLVDEGVGYNAAVASVVNIGYPILLPIGLIGNGLSFAIMIQLAQSSAFYVYLSALSLSDFLLLLLGILPRWIYISGLNPSYSPDQTYFCSLAFYPVLVFSQFSAWVITASTVERYVAIAYPLKTAEFRSKRRALLYLTITFVVICGLNFPSICFSWNDDHTECVTPDITQSYCIEYVAFFYVVLYLTIPTLTMILFNSLIVRQIYLRRDILEQLDDQARDKQKSMTKQATCTLFLVTAAFIVSLLPLAAVTSYVLLSNITMEDVPVFGTVAEFFSLVNHVINFILYGLSDKIFRAKLYQLMCFCRNSK